MNAEIRAERDRYVAFAFAAADLLIETDDNYRIVSATGAAQGVTGHARESLTRSGMLDLIGSSDRRMVEKLFERFPASGRLDPVWVRINHRSGSTPLALLGGCRLPTIPGRMFLSLSLAGPVVRDSAEPFRDADTGLRDAKSLVAAARGVAIDPSGTQPKQMTLMQLSGLGELARRLPDTQAKALMAEIGAVLRARSSGGDSAARLDDDAFGLIEAVGATVPLGEAVGAAMSYAGLAPDALAPTVSRVALSSEGLDEHDVERAIAYAVTEFVGNPGKALNVRNVQEALSAALDRTLAKISDLRQVLASDQITLVYQPIVSLATNQVHHYEALARFADGRNVYETMVFGEEVGVIDEIDLGVCRMALRAMGPGPGPSIAVNVSGRSVQSSQFRSALLELLASSDVRSDRLMFELTESSTVHELESVANFLRDLRRRGHAVCLDDFGAGAAAYGYLRNFDVDFVKIDGPFLRGAFERDREKALIRSICQLCVELGHKTIGEMIENQDQAVAAKAIGIEFGQGWLFGRPAAKPEPPPDLVAKESPPRPPIRGRRVGEVEQWGR